MIFGLLYSVLLPLLLGYLIVFHIGGNDRFGAVERIFLGYGIGTGSVTLILFLMGLARIPFSAGIVSAVAAVIIALLLALMVRAGHSMKDLFSWAPAGERPSAPPRRSRGEHLLIAVLAVWIVAKIFFVLAEAAVWPVHAWDEWTHWSAGAKFLYYEKGLALDRTGEFFFGTGYLKVQRYPLHVPLMQVWTALCIGEAHEVSMKFWNALYFLAIPGLLYSAVRRYSGALVAVAGAYLVAGAPLLTYHALTAYADLAVGYYALCAAVCFRAYLAEAGRSGGTRGTGILVLAGMSAALCLWTKMEGAFFAAAFALGAAAHGMSRKNVVRTVAAYLAPVAAVATVWYVFLFSINVKVDYGEISSVAGAIAGGTAAKAGRSGGLHWEVLPLIAEQLFLSANFGIVALCAAAAGVLGFSRIVHGDLKFLYLAFGAGAGSFVVLYVATEMYQWVVQLTAINRNILLFVPMAGYLAALTASEVLEEQRKRG